MNLRTEIEALIDDSGAERVGVAYRDLATETEILIRADETFHAASTMKVCVMVELFRQDQAGGLRLDETMTVHNEFKSIADGSAYSIGIEDDSYPELFAQIGIEARLIDLCEPMITRSSNLATNMLIERLGADRVQATMNELGAPGLVVLRGVEDGKAYRLGLNNAVTARGLNTIMVKLARREVVSDQASEQMIDILLRQTHRNGIPASLPIEVKVANKTGWNSHACHDTGIVLTADRGSCVLTVLTTGLDEKTTGLDLIASISKLVYDRLITR